MATVTSTCLKCGVTTTGEKFLGCGQCRTARYCCKDCQKADWKNHKAVCKPLSELVSKDSKKTGPEFMAWVKSNRNALIDMAYALIGIDPAAYSEKLVEVFVCKNEDGIVKIDAVKACDRVGGVEAEDRAWDTRDVLSNMGPDVYSPLFRFVCVGFKSEPFIANLPIPFKSTVPRADAVRLEGLRDKSLAQAEVDRIVREINRD